MVKTVRQLIAFGAIGVVSTLAYALLYVLFRAAASATIANAAALLITAVANTAANRRLTFGVTNRQHVWRDHAAGLAAFGFALAITTVAASSISGANVSRAMELVVLIGANAVATVVRFVILRVVMVGRETQPAGQHLD